MISGSLGIERLNYLFPFGNSNTDLMKRDKLFRSMDSEQAGHVTLDAILNVLTEDEDYAIVKKNPQVVRNAFISQFDEPPEKLESATINKDQFKFLLVYLRQYFEFFDVFDRMDLNKDSKVSYEEFVQNTKMLAAWGFKFVNSRVEFSNMDAKGQGFLLFQDFADYCIKKSMSTMKNNLRDSMKILNSQGGKQSRYMVVKLKIKTAKKEKVVERPQSAGKAAKGAKKALARPSSAKKGKKAEDSLSQNQA